MFSENFKCYKLGKFAPNCFIRLTTKNINVFYWANNLQPFKVCVFGFIVMKLKIFIIKHKFYYKKLMYKKAYFGTKLHVLNIPIIKILTWILLYYSNKTRFLEQKTIIMNIYYSNKTIFLE